MHQSAQRHLRILTEIAEGKRVTQRRLARKLGIALGLTNLYLKRLVRKGYIKVTTIPPNRVRYLLTPKGMAEKARLTCQFMEYSLRLYRDTRRLVREHLSARVSGRASRVAVCGAGEAAVLALLTLRELGVEDVRVFAPGGDPETVGGVPAQPLPTLDPNAVDVVVVASFAPAPELVAALAARGLGDERLVILSPGAGYRGSAGRDAASGIG